MEAAKQMLMFMGLLIGVFVLVAHGDSGIASPNTITSPSACDGTDTPSSNTAAISQSMWDDKGACGKRYRITCTGATNLGDTQPCTGASVEVQIVDLCPSPQCTVTFDLSEDAFATIADPGAGQIHIEYEEI